MTKTEFKTVIENFIDNLDYASSIKRTVTFMLIPPVFEYQKHFEVYSGTDHTDFARVRIGCSEEQVCIYAEYYKDGVFYNTFERYAYIGHTDNLMDLFNSYIKNPNDKIRI